MDHFDQSIAALRETLRSHEDKVIETKRLINALSEAGGRGVVYHDADLETRSGIETVQADTFYGQPLNTSARRVLEMRKAAGLGPATVREIYDVLVQGGFQFKTKSEKNSMDSLRISLGKSSHTFHKLPNGSYGLLEWYPGVKEPKKATPSNGDDDNSGDNDNEKGEQQ